MYGQQPLEVVGYTFNADVYCPEHIVSALPTDEGEAYDGWAIAPGARPMSTEDNLTEIAAAFGIDREDESTFDSDEFPKVIFAESAWDVAGQGYPETCAVCHRPLVD